MKRWSRTWSSLFNSAIEKICKALGENRKISPRCVIDESTVTHIINKHGKNGKSDQSFADINDIARLSYVLANFDEVDFEGKYSKRFRDENGEFSPQVSIKKKIDGTYYIIEAVPNGKRKKSYIVSARISL